MCGDYWARGRIEFFSREGVFGALVAVYLNSVGLVQASFSIRTSEWAGLGLCVPAGIIGFSGRLRKTIFTSSRQRSSMPKFPFDFGREVVQERIGCRMYMQRRGDKKQQRAQAR